MSNAPERKKRRYRKRNHKPADKDPIFGVEALEELGNACDLHEDFKPLRGVPRSEYLKAIYDPEPEE